MNVEYCYDNSQLSTYTTCPFSYYLQYVKGLRKAQIDDSNAAMNFGSAVHTALEKLYKREVDFCDYEEPERLHKFSRTALNFAIDTYRDHYDDNFEMLETEQVAEVDIGDYKFLVKKDGAFKQNGSIYGLEHKTTASIAENYFEKFEIGSQIPAQYFTVLQDYKSCSGILLNAIEVKFLKRKPTSSKYTDWMEYMDGWLTVRFERDYIQLEQKKIDDWFSNTLMQIELIEDSKMTQEWPKSNGIWGGLICTKCQYKELCNASYGTELDKELLEHAYEEYDAYEYLKEE